MSHNLDYDLEKGTDRCFSCGEEFSYYKVQEIPKLNSCAKCRLPKLAEITSVFKTMAIIGRFAETNKIIVDNRDAVYLDELIEYLHK